MKRLALSALCLFASSLIFAETAVKQEINFPVSEITPMQNVLSLSSAQADWAFSGMVTNESGEHYNFYLQIQRNNKQFYAVATLIDEVNKNVILYEEGHAEIDNANGTSWQVGHIFVRYNPINNSWVFGVKNSNDRGFNFKVDMMGLSDKVSSKQQGLRNGVEFLVSQTGRLNGHIQTGGKEQFVTAPKAWFRQIWVSKPQALKHPLTGILCDFHDGSAFYSVSLPESDALRGAIAGWRDDKGIPVAMSQFVSIEEEKQGSWQIHIPSPKVNLNVQDMLFSMNGNHHLVAGLITGSLTGFCAISQNEIVEETAEPIS